jgi:hypothetical protein
MAEPNSNAVLTVTVQAQDLISGQNNLVNSTPPSVIFPATTNLNYGGYITVTSSLTTNLFTGLSPGCPFLYVRNATPGGGSNELSVTFTPTGGVLQAIVLAQGGVFIFGNRMVGANPQTTLSQAGYFVGAVGEITIMEYFWAS